MLVYEDRVAPERGNGDRRQVERRRTVPAGLSVRAVVTVLRRRASWILICAILGTVGAFVAGKSLTPRYSAEAQLYIDPRDLRLVEKELTSGGQDSSAYLTIVESQAQVITSASVLNRVITQLDLVNDPEFVGSGSGLLGLIGLGGSAPESARGKAEAALGALEKRITIRRTGRTFIVDVAAWSRDAEKAAKLANAVVAAYLAEESSNRTEAANRASSGLSARLGELRDAVGRAENEVQAYKAQNGLVGTRDTLVTDQQLTQINAQLAAARVRATDAQARVEQLQRVLASGSDAGANQDALASQTISTMRAQYAELSRKQAELLNDLGPRHPQVSSISSQLQQSRRMIDQEITRYVQSAKTERDRALANVASLEKSFEAAKERTVGQAQASIRLRELEREVETQRAVYQSFMLRAQETGQQARLDLGNARIITQAVKPVTRSFPPSAKVLAMLGLVGGLFLGIGLAFADDLLRRSMAASEPAARPAPMPAPAHPMVAEPVSQPEIQHADVRLDAAAAVQVVAARIAEPAQPVVPETISAEPVSAEPALPSEPQHTEYGAAAHRAARARLDPAAVVGVAPRTAPRPRLPDPIPVVRRIRTRPLFDQPEAAL